MNLLDSIMNAGNGAAVRQIGAEVGPDEAQATAALSALDDITGMIGRTFGRT